MADSSELLHRVMLIAHMRSHLARCFLSDSDSDTNVVILFGDVNDLCKGEVDVVLGMLEESAD